MQFILSDLVYENYINLNTYVILKKDSWNDWFAYKTLFSVYFCEKESEPKWLGNIKIGFLNNDYLSEEIGTNTYYSPNLPNEFTSLLNTNFYSLGQDSTYYESLNNLPEDIRIEILKSLNDISYNLVLFKQVENEAVTTSSLLRNVSITSIRGQFHRLSHGNCELTPFEFKYLPPNNKEVELYISVKPNSIPPTNIHVLVGRNGVGKTHLLSNIVNLLKTQNDIYGNLEYFVNDEHFTENSFANLLTVSFSAFDFGFETTYSENIRFESIGWKLQKENDSNDFSFVGLSTKMLLDSFKVIVSSGRINRWKQTISLLNCDPMFKQYDLTHLIDYLGSNDDYIHNIFIRLSSGHKIVFLTLTQLVEKVEERSLIIFDEPELHLHPPLLSAFIRALSQLLSTKNAVSIIATHSPVILQEVPKKCVTIIDRISKTDYISLRKPLIETFGTNTGLLTNEVFNLEVSDSGFHSILKELVYKYDTLEDILKKLDYQIGLEGMSILISLFNEIKGDIINE